MVLKFIAIFFFFLSLYIIYLSSYYQNLFENFCEISPFFDTILSLVTFKYKGALEAVAITHKDEKEHVKKTQAFTQEELKQFVNLKKGLYLSILGQVFDVSKGLKHYGPGGSYHFFTGRDASAAFISGDFTETGLLDDVSGLSNKDIISLFKWVDFYKESYIYKGVLIGRYYSQNGEPTEERHNLEQKLKHAKDEEINEEQNKKIFPPCNIEWKEETGTRVWCTQNSGGIAREWIGVPRQLFESPFTKNKRCACVNLNSIDYKENAGILHAYPNCNKNSRSCVLNNY